MIFFFFFLLSCMNNNFSNREKWLVNKAIKEQVAKAAKYNNIPQEILDYLTNIDNKGLAESKEIADNFIGGCLNHFNFDIMTEGYQSVINLSCFYIYDYLLKTKHEHRVEIIKNLSQVKITSIATNLNLLHFAVYYNDVEVFREFYNYEFDFFGRSLGKIDLGDRGTYFGAKFSPLMMLPYLRTEEECIEFIDGIKDVISKEDLENSFILHLAASLFMVDLVEYLVIDVKMNINSIMSFETELYRGKIIDLANPQGVDIEIRDNTHSVIGGMVFFISDTASASLKIEEKIGKDRVRHENMFVDYESKDIDGNDFRRGIIAPQANIIERMTQAIRDKNRPTFEEKISETEDKFAAIIDILIANGYDIKIDSSYGTLFDALVLRIGGKAIEAMIRAGYKLQLSKNSYITLRGTKGSMDDERFNRIVRILPYLTLNELSDENMEVINRSLKIPADGVSKASLLIKKAKKYENNELLKFVIRYPEKLGVKKDEIYDLRSSGGSKTFLTHLMQISEEQNSNIQELIDLALEHGFITNKTRKELKKRKQEKQRAEDIKELLDLSKQIKEEDREKDKKNRERLEKIKRDAIKRRAEELDEAASAAVLAVEGASGFNVSRMSDEEINEQFIGAIYSSNYSILIQLLSYVNVEELTTKKDIKLEDLNEERMITILLNNNAILTKELVLKAIHNDWKRVMSKIVNNRLREEIRMLLSIKEEDIKTKISDAMLNIFGGILRNNFINFNKKFDVKEEELKVEGGKELTICFMDNVKSEIDRLETEEKRLKINNRLGDIKRGRFVNIRAVQNTEKVRECRILGNDNLRIYYVRKEDNIIVLKVFEKKDSVPIQEIQKLENLLEDCDISLLYIYLTE